MTPALKTMIATVTLAAVPLVTPSANNAPDRPTLAVVDFETAPASSILPPEHLGSALAQLMLDRLVASGEYRVIDGRWLAITRNRDGSQNIDAVRGYAESSGVDYLVLGSMTHFYAENRRRTYGGGLIIPLIAGVRRQKLELVMGITVRVVDVRTGEVATTATSQGVSDRKRVSVGGLAAFSRGGVGGFSNDSSGSRDAQLSEAAVRAVATAAQGIINAAPKLRISN